MQLGKKEERQPKESAIGGSGGILKSAQRMSAALAKNGGGAVQLCLPPRNSRAGKTIRKTKKADTMDVGYVYLTSSSETTTNPPPIQSVVENTKTYRCKCLHPKSWFSSGKAYRVPRELQVHMYAETCGP